MKRCRLKRYNFEIRNKMSKENETSDKQQKGNDFIADVSIMYCDCDKPTLGINTWTCGCGKWFKKLKK